jgi:hypothetical protein
MADKEIIDSVWEMIIDDIHEHRCIPFLGAAANISGYLFSWDNIQGDNSKKFIDFFKLYYDINWINTQNIEKIDANTIRVLANNKSLVLRLNNDKTKVSLTIDDIIKDEYVAKAENDKLNIYYYEGLPLGQDVAKKLADVLKLVVCDQTSLPRVALQGEVETERKRLVKKLEDIISDSNCHPSPLLNSLARLPFKTYITTNFDRLLECALEKNKKDFEIIIQIPCGFREELVKKKFDELEKKDGVLIYKIHGTFLNGITNTNPSDKIVDRYITFLKEVLSDEQYKNRICMNLDDGNEVSPVIITEDDYFEFMTIMNMESGTIGIPKYVKSKIAPSTILFLGYSLEDWDFRTLYKGLVEKGSRQFAKKSFAIQKNPSKLMVKFWEAKGIEIYDMHVYDFAKLLEDKYWAKYRNCNCEKYCKKLKSP